VKAGAKRRAPRLIVIVLVLVVVLVLDLVGAELGLGLFVEKRLRG